MLLRTSVRFIKESMLGQGLSTCCSRARRSGGVGRGWFSQKNPEWHLSWHLSLLAASRGHGERSPCRVLPSTSTVEAGETTEMKKALGDPWFVYIVRCADGSLYTGITKDLKRRCEQHNDGTASRYTRSRRPTELVWQEAQPSRGSALKREAAIKAMTRRDKLALIRLRKKAG
jgi:predicted GIY-YIG superfamily endonuclease